MAREFTPTVSMSPHARYVTQTNVYGTFYTGPLTDRKIKMYAKLGKYGPEAQKAANANKPIRKAKLQRRETKKEQLLRLLLA